MKPFNHYILLAVLAVVASSCKLGQRYARPDLDMPAAYDSAAMDDSTSVADLPWNKIYGDTVLQGLIERMLDNNKDLLMAAARVKELAAMKRIDFARLFPNVGVRLYSEKETDNYGGNNSKPSDQFDIKAVIAWELDLWGNLRWAKDKSVAELVGSIENQRAIKMSLVAQMAESYFELVALDNELSIVEQTVEARRQSLHLAKIRYEGGLTSETAFRQAQVELARTEALVPDLERRIAIKENEIAFMMGEYSCEVERAHMPEDVMVPVSLPMGLPSTLLERRPDIRQAEQRLIAANANVGIAYTNMFPRIALTAHLGAESDELGEILKSPYHLLSASLLQPIFAMGANRARHKASQAAYEREVYSYEKTVLNAFREVRDAITDFNKSKDIYETSFRLERASRTSLDLAQLQYMNGVIGYMDLLDAQRTYLTAQIGLSNAIRDKQISVVNLYKALGGGWQD